MKVHGIYLKKKKNIKSPRNPIHSLHVHSLNPYEMTIIQTPFCQAAQLMSELMLSVRQRTAA